MPEVSGHQELSLAGEGNREESLIVRIRQGLAQRRRGDRNSIGFHLVEE